MRHLERPSSESAFPLRVWSSSLSKTVQGKQNSSKASLSDSQIHLHVYSIAPASLSLSRFPQQLRGHSVEFVRGRSLLCGNGWMLAGPSLQGQHWLMDMLEALFLLKCLCEKMWLNDKRMNMHLPWHSSLLLSTSRLPEAEVAQPAELCWHLRLLNLIQNTLLPCKFSSLPCFCVQVKGPDFVFCFSSFQTGLKSVFHLAFL